MAAGTKTQTVERGPYRPLEVVKDKGGMYAIAGWTGKLTSGRFHFRENACATADAARAKFLAKCRAEGRLP